MARRMGWLAAVALFLAHGGYAMFRAAERVVVPVAASLPGLNSTNWHTNLEILNVDTVNADVRIVFLPSGNQDDTAWNIHAPKHADFQPHQLGWDATLFGHVVTSLGGIEPGKSVILDKVLSKWGDEGADVKGALIVYAYKSGTYGTENEATANIVVTSRTYTEATASDGTTQTYGQEVPGLPWPTTFDNATQSGLDNVTFTGIREDDSFRTAVGLVGLSAGPVDIDLTLEKADGTQLGTVTETLQPYAHVQFDRAVQRLFGLGVDDPDLSGGGMLKAALHPLPQGVTRKGPAFVAYCSRVDNGTNSPDYLEATYDAELNWNCVYNNTNCPSSQTATAPGTLAMFRAASLQVVPVVAAITGSNSSNWQSDVEIRNVSTVPVDVIVIFLPTGGGNNFSWYLNIANALLPWSGQGSNHVNTNLASIPPGHAVTLTNVVATGGTDKTDNGWGTDTKGALLIWAFKSGTKPPSSTPMDIVVTSRTSTPPPTSGAPGTYGQEIPGLPWYDYIDPERDSQGYNKVTFTGIREDASYRTAVGLVNVSDGLTNVYPDLNLQDLKDANGNTIMDTTVTPAVPLVKDVGLLIYPLSHLQYDDATQTVFSLSATTYPAVVGATLTVRVKSWESTAAQPTPALIVYCSRVDNHTNAPVYLEQTWGKELPWGCAFDGQNCTSATAIHAQRAAQPRFRPLDPPRP